MLSRITLLIFKAVFLFNCLDAQIEQFLFENRVHDIISQKRLESKGFGESHLLNDCRDGIVCSEEEHSVNRRTEFIVTRITPCNN